jgi:hypothetical protein
MTPLDKSLKRALNIKGRDYVIHLTPDSLKITEKGRRLGVELKWQELISGEAALAVALQASIGKLGTADDQNKQSARSQTAKKKVLDSPRQKPQRPQPTRMR